MANPKDDLLAWLRDAHAMELQAIEMLEKQERRVSDYPALQARLREHVEETRGQARLLEDCIRRRNSSTSTLKDLAGKFMGTMQALSGVVFSDEVVKGTIAGYTFEHYEIACYRVLAAAARMDGDNETAEVCERIMRQEEAMAEWLASHQAEITEQYLRRTAAETVS
jgi:ferritin-like metal-binding protein YciE